MGVVELGGGLDFSQKALGPNGGGELGTEDLDRDKAIVLQVPSEVHGGHAPRADFPLDGVTVGEGGFEAV